MTAGDLPSEFGERFVRGEELVRRPNCVVFKATDKLLGGREVALKIFQDRSQGNIEWIKEFDSEVAKLRRASHPTLVPILAGGESAGWFYLALEFINGSTLRDLIKANDGPLELNESLAVIRHLAEALQELHEEGCVHGHVDTRAIMFKDHRVVLAGYCPVAIDKILRSVTSDGRMTVDAQCIAPEQVEGGSVDHRADLYALGVVFFEMVTGKRPFNSNNPLQLAMQRLSGPVPSPAAIASVPARIDSLIIKLLAKKPEERFQSAAEFLQELSVAENTTNEVVSALPPDTSDTTATIPVSMSADAIKQLLKKGEPEGDVQATMMGGSLDKLMPAALFVLEGAKRGERVSIDRPQTIFGSDPLGEVVLTGKGVPRRAGIIVKRGDDYIIESLSGAELELNGEVIPTEGARLKRGDILTTGDSKLRFIAPGEIFTFDASTADRVIDRPKNSLRKVTVSLITVVLALCAVAIYLFTTQQESRDDRLKRQAQLASKQEDEEIKRLTELGDTYYKNGALIEPVGANAREVFQQIALKRPNDNYAKRRLQDIQEREQSLLDEKARKKQFEARVQELLNEGERQFQARDLIAPPGKNARETYKEVLRLAPENEVAKKRVAEIDSAISDMLGRVGSLVARARALKEQRQFVLPKGGSAYDVIQEVLKIDPQNAEAKDLLYEMAASSIFDGNRAKANVDPSGMKRGYITAQALGMDPEYIQDQLKNIKLMGQTKSSVMVVSRPSETPSDQAKPKDSKYLDTSEVLRRVRVLELDLTGEEKGNGRSFIEVDSGPVEKGKKR